MPVDERREQFLEAKGPRVLTAPPGSGKSTRVPLWCAEEGPVLVVQPRRVAARSLANFLGRQSGGEVGYAVRGASHQLDAPILFVTPGVALRMLPEARRFRTVILDEFHERTLDLDLLLALCHAREDLRLVVLSATLDGDRVASHLDGVHLEAQGRLYPVELRYDDGPGRALPRVEQLGARVKRALAAVEDVSGDRLVFVPGRAEIAEVCASLAGCGDEVLPLHGQLSLREQGRVFRPGERRRVIVATNVAETSLTLPRIGVVIDSGLVRRTHYYDGRGYLLLGPVAQDAAEQRAGRAGRLGPGVAVRLWGERAPLRPRTPPEIHRESLVPLLLAAAAAGHPKLDLPFLDPPAEHAVQTARERLMELGALGEDGSITERGRRLFHIPLDPHLAHLLVVAEARGWLAEAIDLVAALSSPRRLFVASRAEEDLRDERCDATALIRAVRIGQSRIHGLDREVLQDVRREVERLRHAFGEPERRPWDRAAFAAVVVEAWPRSAHVARRRGRRVYWSNGGTEVTLDRGSAVSEKAEALLALDLRASGRDRLHRELRITAALPVRREELAALGVGEERLGEARLERGRVVVTVERVYAGSVLLRETRVPSGRLAREAVADRLLAGQLWPGFRDRLLERHRAVALARALDGEPPLPAPAQWLVERLEEVGLEAPDELELLEPEDLLPPALDEERLNRLARDFPPMLTLGTARFRVEVRPGAKLVELHNLGARLKSLPQVGWLPGFRGFGVVVVDRGVRRWLRRR